MKSKFLYLIFSVCLVAENVSAFELCGDIRQGEFIIGKAREASKILLNEDELLSSKDGYFLVAFGRDEKDTQKLKR